MGCDSLMDILSSPSAVMVVFDPTTYSVTEGGSVNITLTTDSGFSVPFNVTLSSDSDEGRVAWAWACLHACIHSCTSAQTIGHMCYIRTHLVKSAFVPEVLVCTPSIKTILVFNDLIN